jgi:dihydrofolate synthase/folylpolyglutamate synthase
MLKAFNDLEIDLSLVKKVHVTGTNGKGSTAKTIQNILYKSDKNNIVGLYTSPYLEKFNERIRINSLDISNSDLEFYLEFILNFNDKFEENYHESLTFFELTTLMAFKYFKDKKCNYLVIEVGIGGSFDPTNILNYDISVITSIGYDHMQQLGFSLEEILSNKLGILKDNGTLFTTVDSSFYSQMESDAKNKNAKLFLFDTESIYKRNNSFFLEGYKFKVNLLGDYQINNAYLAIKVSLYLINDLDLNKVKKIIREIKFKGRLEKIEENLYIDGAHNEHALRNVINSLPNIFVNKKIGIVFSCLADKDVSTMIDILNNSKLEFIVTSFKDLRFKDLIPRISSARYIEYFPQAIEELKKTNDIVLVLGSIHFIGLVRKYFKG